MAETRRARLYSLVLVIALAAACGGRGSATPATSTGPASTSSAVATDGQPYPDGEVVRSIRADASGGSGDALVVDLAYPPAGEPTIVRQQITGTGNRASQIIVEARDGARATVELGGDGLPVRLTEANGATTILDWSQWASGTLRLRRGTSAAGAEAGVPVSMALTPQQRSAIDGFVGQIRQMRASVPGQHPIALVTADTGTPSIQLPLVARDITLTDARGQNVSGASRVASVQCTPPVVCRWQGGANARAVQVNITMEVPVAVPHDDAWTRVRDACEQKQTRWGNWLEHAATVGGILAALVLPESRVVALFAASQGPQIGKSVNLLRDCDRFADYEQGTKILVAKPAVTTLKFCLATDDRPPLVQCHDERITASPSGPLNARAFTMKLDAASGASAATPTATLVTRPAQTPTQAPARTAAPTTAPTQRAATATAVATQRAVATPAASPAKITGVTYPSEVKGGTRGTTTVTWTGTLKHPARISWVPYVGPDGCAGGGAVDCGFGSWTIDPSFTGNSFRIDGSPSCPAVTRKWIIAWDVTIVDGNGRSAPYRITSACVP